jgi:hypothetical protein
MARGRIVSFNALTTQSIYVSSSGRLFIRSTLRSARRAQIGRTKDLEPGYKIGGQGYARGERFQGNTLVGTSEFASGARQFTAKFDSGFSTCTLNVVMGTSGGTTMRLKGASGEMVDINSISAVSPTCLIQSGNAFAGQ